LCAPAGFAGKLRAVGLSRSISRFPTSGYVRQARRLRATLGREPAKLHRALRELSAGEPVQPASPASRLAALAASQMQGDILSYSARLSLLKQAQRLGIERFEANLIIASAQHRARPVRREASQRRSFGVFGPAIAVVMVEGLLLLAAWWAWIR
jgi:hypothetical protein